MKLFSVCMGAWMAGYILPELFVILAPRQMSVRYGFNVFCAFTAAFIAYGVAA